MKKRIIGAVVALILLISGIWFFWPEFILLTTSLPETPDTMEKRFGVSTFDVSGAGGDGNRVFSSYRLGAGRILWCEHTLGGSLSDEIIAADVLYQLGKEEKDIISNKSLQSTGDNAVL